MTCVSFFHVIFSLEFGAPCSSTFECYELVTRKLQHTSASYEPWDWYLYGMFTYSIKIHHSWIGRSKDEGARPSVYLDESPSYRALGPYWKRLCRHKTYALSPVVYWWDFLDANFLRVLNCSFDEAYKWDMFSGYFHTNSTPPSINKALLRTTNHHCPLVGPSHWQGPTQTSPRIDSPDKSSYFVCLFVLGRCCLGDVWTESVEKHEFLALLQKKEPGLLKT